MTTHRLNDAQKLYFVHYSVQLRSAESIDDLRPPGFVEAPTTRHVNYSGDDAGLREVAKSKRVGLVAHTSPRCRD